MISENGGTQGGDLDALSPRLPSRAPRPEPTSWTFPSPEAPAPAQPWHRHTRRRPSTEELRAGNEEARRLFGSFWADPCRMFWSPILAGAAAHLWEIDPTLLPDEYLSAVVVLASATTGNGPYSGSAGGKRNLFRKGR